MFSTHRLLSCLTAASVVCVSSAAMAQTVAVEFGGNPVNGNSNSSLDDGAQLQVDFGDFNGDGVSDARTFIPIDHSGVFIGAGQMPNAGISAGATSTLRAGMQIVNYSSATPSDVQLFRVNDRGANPDTLQMTTAAQAGGALTQGMVFAPHVSKDSFLNGLSGATELSFVDAADSFDVTYFWNTNVVASAPGADEQLRRGRLMVQDGSQWYISEARIGSKGSGGSPNVLSINPATEMWFPIDLSNDFYYQEIGGGDTTPTGTTIGSPVLGSTFNDIQALGAHLILNNFDGSSNNAGNVEVLDIGASLNAVFPAPPEPQVGFPVAIWDMDTVVPGVSTDDQFGNTFTSDAVLDASGTVNPSLLGGDVTDPLLLGDVTPGGSLGPVPASTKPVQTVGGGGIDGVGEALSFDGVDDEAIAITAWAADTSETLFIPGLEGVHVNVDFKEVDNTNGTQMIAGARSIWELRIDTDGNLEWVTWLDGGGNDTIEVPLGTEGDWREVEAFHLPNGDKALYLDGVLVGQSATGAPLRVDRRSILLGNQENQTWNFEGLIDNVYVGSGRLLGDLDVDFGLTVADIDALGDAIGIATSQIEGDIDNDGDVDLDDLTAWLTLVNTVNGDANLDGQVGTADLAILAGNFNNAVTSFGDGDYNLDGTVDTADLAILAGTFGTGVGPASAAVAAVPEPASLALLGLGGLAILGRRRK